ncbi:MAG: riboflavin biosynthesis protein RibF, partial [Halobacteriales archaeon]|nr:riboflavin biosynthesis protein RibF [Halobacteriales archaeon]
LSIGKFDGVHLGHRKLIASVCDLAAHLGARPAVLVLHPDPASVLADRRVQVLDAPSDRLTRIRRLGPEIVRELRFDTDLARLPPGAFLDRLEISYQLRGLVVGPDFRFGRDRAGDVAYLKEEAPQRGLRVRVVSPVHLGGQRVSSGRIRDSVSRGAMREAAEMMTRPHAIRGTVVHGAKRGRTLGYPTANIEPDLDYVLPADGVYAGRIRWSGPSGEPRVFDTALSVGIRPTFDAGRRSVEAFVLGFAGDLYGRSVTLEIHERIRGEIQFEDVDGLLDAMAQDIRTTRRIMSEPIDRTTFPAPEEPAGHKAPATTDRPSDIPGS